jgi:hypothetical protein
MELDFQSLFGRLCRAAVVIGWDLATPPPLIPPAFCLIYSTRTLLVSQDRRHHFCNPLEETEGGERGERDYSKHCKNLCWDGDCKHLLHYSWETLYRQSCKHSPASSLLLVNAEPSYTNSTLLGGRVVFFYSTVVVSELLLKSFRGQFSGSLRGD